MCNVSLSYTPTYSGQIDTDRVAEICIIAVDTHLMENSLFGLRIKPFIYALVGLTPIYRIYL